MKRQLARISAIISGSSALFLSCSPNRQQQPNVLFILADDYGWNDLGCGGSDYYETPNIDRIAQNGVFFSNSYSACSVSSPSRASIMTGLAPARHGITNWIGDPFGLEVAKKNNTPIIQPSYVEELPLSEKTLVRSLKECGYSTMIAGKWHLGDTDPIEYGFDVNAGGYSAGNPKGGYFSPYNNPRLSDGPAGEDLNIRLARETIDFMEKKLEEKEPFFAFLSFYAVHGPIQTTKDKWEYFRDKAERQGIEEDGFYVDRTLPVRKKQDNPVYAGLISSMDDAIGLVLDELKAKKALDNTIVIFTADNGGVASGDNYSTSCAPLRGGKGRQWEGGTRVPLVMMGPSVKGKGRKELSPVIQMDLYPTIMDMIGHPLSGNGTEDGISLRKLIESNEPLEERPFFWHYPHYGNQGGEPSSYVIRGNWKLIHYWEDGRDELYDIKDDISEQDNVIQANTSIATELHNLLFEWLQDTNAKIPEKNPFFREAEYAQFIIDRQERQLRRQEEIRKDQLTKSWSPNDDWWGSLVPVND